MAGPEVKTESAEVQSEAPKTTEQAAPKPEKTPEQKGVDKSLSKQEGQSNDHVADTAVKNSEALDAAASGKKQEDDEQADPKKEEPSKWDSLVKYWEKSMKESKGELTVTAVLGTLYHAYKLWFGEEETSDDEVDEDSDDAPDGKRYRFDDPSFDPEDPKFDKIKAQAKKQLAEMKDKHEDWLGIAETASERYKLGAKGPSIIFAMSRFESGFNPDAKATASSATGLGQFIKGTWESFQKSLPEGDKLKGKPATDPEAALTAIAWYTRSNMDACGLTPDQDDLAARVYETHHEGAAGAKKLWAFRNGGPEGKVPKSYLGKKFPKFGVEEVKSYKDYSDLVKAMSDRVQVVALDYEVELEPEEGLKLAA